MSGGIFLLLCVLAFLIGTRAQKSRAGTLSAKAIRQREKFKLVLMWASFVVVVAIMLLYFPAVVEKIMIARDTRWDWDTVLSIGIFVFGIFTAYTILRAVKKQPKSNQ